MGSAVVGEAMKELANVSYGYDVAYKGQPPKWWLLPQFPLVPMWEYRPGDKYNTSSWTFSWLCLRYWSLDVFELKLGAGFDTFALGGSAFRIGAILPYTRLILSVPLPLGFLDRLRRRPPIDGPEPDRA